MKREHRIAVATTAFALGIPVATAGWVHVRTAALADHLGQRAATHAQIGGIDADLTGTVQLREVALGELFAAETIEASFGLDCLLAGTLVADEIRVAAPRIALQVDRDGDSDLARLVRRLARSHTSGSSAPAAPRSRSGSVRRIVVSRGTLTAHITGVGDIAAESVQLVPDAGGVRVITGRLRIHAGNAQVRGDIELARAAAELSLPRATFRRVLAVAGAGTLEVGARTVALRDIAIGRLRDGGMLEARGFLDDGGVPRAIAAELVPPTQARPGFALSVAGTAIPLAPLAALAPHAIGLDGARATGQLTLRGDSGAIALATELALTGVRIDHHALSQAPQTLDATLAASLTIAPNAVVVDHAAVAIGAAHWAGAGWLRRGATISGQLDLQLEEAPCMTLFESLSPELRGPLDGIAMTGTFAGRARLAVDLAAPPGLGVELDAVLDNRCEVASEPPAADVTRLAGKPREPDLDKLPAYVPGAFIAAEDSRFYEHHGFDLYQIARSLEIDLRDRRLARGGSTISQQLVKNELLTQRRSLDRKIQEALLTWRLEARLDKKTILRRYLEIIELGPHVQGVAAAARFWFDKPARELTVKQAAFLAALTSEPQSMSRRVRHDAGLDADSAARVETVLRAMRRSGVIDKVELDAARDKPMHFAATALRHEL